jgi:hypothetical protein
LRCNNFNQEFAFFMLNKIVSFGLVLLLCLQGSREVLIGTWFYSHQKAIVASKCINKDRPAMKCNGKCHLKRTLEASDQNNTQPIGLPSMEDRSEVYNLPVNGQLEVWAFSTQGTLIDWYYQFNYDFSLDFFVFHPPRV